MSHRRHRAALHQCHAAMFGRPVHQPRPWKFRPPAEPARQWRKAHLEDFAWTAFRADVVDQNEFTARLQHTHEIIERRFGIGHRGNDVLRHHRIERTVRKREILRIRSCALRSIGSEMSTPCSFVLRE